jgi:outer membrane lipoprotein SlyB
MQQDGGATAAAGSAMPNGTVLAIEVMPSSSVGTESGSMGASGAAGATGSSGSDQSYRVTVRKDDGSTEVVTHNSTPDFRSGDRINVTSGVIQR